MVLESNTSTNNASSHNDYGSLEDGADECNTKLDVRHVPLVVHAELPQAQEHEPPPLISVGSKAVGTMTSNQGLNDLYQRTPLLSNSTTNGEHSSSQWREANSNGKIVFTTHEQVDDTRKKPSLNSNGIVSIDIPITSGDQIQKFPPEKLKTCIAFVILVFNLLLTTTTLAVVHERVPDRNIYQPLPDIFLDNVTALDWTLYLSEILIMISTYLMLFVLFIHRHRFIVLRRLFLMLALLYFLRSCTMYVTVLPMSSKTYNCSEKANSTSPRIIATRVIQLFSGFGLSINGKHTYCGDYIYSGHTTILVMSYLMISEYSPKKYFILHWSAFVMAVVGVLMVLVAHGHYTVDVLIAYYITTRLFWLYHTLCNNEQLKQKTPYNYLSNVWWFRIFQYFEGNVHGPVPRQYESPLKCFAKYTSRRSTRNS